MSSVSSLRAVLARRASVGGAPASAAARRPARRAAGARRQRCGRSPKSTERVVHGGREQAWPHAAGGARRTLRRPAPSVGESGRASDARRRRRSRTTSHGRTAATECARHACDDVGHGTHVPESYHDRNSLSTIAPLTSRWHYSSPAVEAATGSGRSGASLTTAERRVAEVVLAAAAARRVRHGRRARRRTRSRARRPSCAWRPSSASTGSPRCRRRSSTTSPGSSARPRCGSASTAAGGAVDTHLRLELENVRATLQGASGRRAAEAVVRVLSDAAVRVHVLSGDASRGVACSSRDDLDALRPGVSLLGRQRGPPRAQGRAARTRRRRGRTRPAPLRPLGRRRRAPSEGRRRTVIAVTDSLLSPLSATADHTLVVDRRGRGTVRQPRRHAGAVQPPRRRRRRTAAGVATERLERAEHAWAAAGALVDR